MEGHVNFTLSDRLRKSPYYEATLRAGAKTFTIYNHMIMPHMKVLRQITGT